MHRRTFLQMAAAAPAALAAPDRKLPKYRVVSHYQPAAQPGMPGPYPGQVASVHAANCIDEATEKPDPAVVREMKSEEHTYELQSPCNLVCRLLLAKKTR